MNESQEVNMRANIADYTNREFSDLAVRLQNTIDVHMSEKQGMKDAVSQMARQNEALRTENERLEELTSGVAQVDSEEVEQLRARVAELDEINSGLQKTIIKLSS